MMPNFQDLPYPNSEMGVSSHVLSRSAQSKFPGFGTKKCHELLYETYNNEFSYGPETVYFSQQKASDRDMKKRQRIDRQTQNRHSLSPFSAHLRLFLFFCFSPLRCHVGFADTNLVRDSPEAPKDRCN